MSACCRGPQLKSWRSLLLSVSWWEFDTQCQNLEKVNKWNQQTVLCPAWLIFKCCQLPDDFEAEPVVGVLVLRAATGDGVRWAVTPGLAWSCSDSWRGLSNPWEYSATRLEREVYSVSYSCSPNQKRLASIDEQSWFFGLPPLGVVHKHVTRTKL